MRNEQWEADKQLIAEHAPNLPPDLDPYRCPDCDGNVARPIHLDPQLRAPGDGWRCLTHGIVNPHYDSDRSQRLAWTIPFEDDE